MAVTVRVEPEEPRLPGSLDLSAYRIVQEALTNAFRHGRAASAAVAVRCDARQVEVEVRDDGRGPQPGYQMGRGLLGIGERAALFGGTVEHGAHDGGGFRITVVLPMPGDNAALPLENAALPGERVALPGESVAPAGESAA